ncbi:glycosyltransferase [Liquorilactobacillus hordei]|uniref:glycosyltransferase n=1 Tax=Liquorilactobacillus hordei TaxID=468911 RepID=UPI0039E7C36E
MINNDKISVVVPIYNKEKFLSRCIHSILRQTYVNLELILVDDGSTDGSFKICRKIEKEDSRVKCISKANEGVAKARNYGLKFVTGKYIMFVDADDYVKDTMLSSMKKESNNDLVVCNYQTKKEEKTYNNKLVNKKFHNFEEIKNGIFKKNIFPFMVVPWLKLFKMDIINKNNITFDNITIGEDACFVLEYLRYCKSLKMIDDVLYVNVVTENSISRKKIKFLWKYNQYMIDKITDLYNVRKGDGIWRFLIVRGFNIELGNTSKSLKDFLSTCQRIKKTDEFRSIHWKTIDDFKDKMIIFMLKKNFYIILWMLFEMKGG